MRRTANRPMAWLLVCLHLIALSGCAQNSDSTAVAQYLASISSNKSLLNQFFMYMPKGGDIHNHLTGAAYAETYFSLAAQDSFWVNMDNGKLYATKQDAIKDNVPNPLQLMPNMPNLHATRIKLIDLWSIRNFNPSKSSLAPDEYFFGTFGLFSAITGKHMVDLLRELKQRAVMEKVQYLEIMATSPSLDKNQIPNYDRQNKWIAAAIVNQDPLLVDSLAAIYNQWGKNAYMQKQITGYIKKIDSIDVKSKLNVAFEPTCLYQSYASRNSDPLSVYAQLYVSFKACVDPSNTKVVGVNIVSAENGEQSMLYYTGHMKMFDYLKKATGGNVKTSLHAGEMTLGLVKPEELGSHIRNAVYVAKANRIGHGVDISFENGSISLINEMKNRSIPVEINLVSNEFILGVSGGDHPFPLYQKAGVPLVISTDDPGILRTNLAEQYTLLVLRYNVSYYDIKKLVRNSITYSFALPDTKKALLDEVNKRFDEFESTWVENISSLNEWGVLSGGVLKL